MIWHDRWIDPPDDTISWANPRHEIIVWETQEDQPVFAVFLDEKWVNSYTTLLDEHAPVTFRYWMPVPTRPANVTPIHVWMRRAREADDACD